MIAKTKYGLVRGKQRGRYLEFLGIPFAKAPTGELRWRPPVAPDPWEGEYDATDYGYQSIQDNSLGSVRGKGISEDCLNLNVVTPAVDHGKRPVVVLYTGGGSTNGGNNGSDFTGDIFFGKRDMVLVFPNFRMGMLGFLYLGHLLGEEYQSSGSCGLRDQIFALKWVRENIENFGGDPDNVTIMGQSAGGKTVSNIMLAPSADGLYRRAIAMSGANQVIRDVETTRAVTNRILRVNGMDPKDAPKLLTMPADDILAMQMKYMAKYDHHTGPVYDGVVLPVNWEERLLPGKKKGISVLIGHTQEEYPSVPQPVPDDEGVLEKARIIYGDLGDHVYSVFKEYSRTMPRYAAWTKVLTQYNYGDAAVRYAKRLAGAGASVWSYRWDYQEGGLRASHGSDMGYACGMTKLKAKVRPAHFDFVCDMMNESFLNFIEKGDPRTKDTPGWLPYTDEAEGTRMYYSEYPSAESFSLDNYDHDFPDSQMKLRDQE